MHIEQKKIQISPSQGNKIILMSHPSSNTDNQIPSPPHALTYFLPFTSVKLHGWPRQFAWLLMELISF